MLAEDTGSDIAFLNRNMKKSQIGVSIVGDVKGKVAVIVQDIADSCRMLSLSPHSFVLFPFRFFLSFSLLQPTKKYQNSVLVVGDVKGKLLLLLPIVPYVPHSLFPQSFLTYTREKSRNGGFFYMGAVKNTGLLHTSTFRKFHINNKNSKKKKINK
jgi:hypothetical protein